MSSALETEFNLGETVQKWNKALIENDPLDKEDVMSLARDSVRLVSHLHRISIRELEEEGGEEVGWGNSIGYIGLNTDGEPWVSLNYKIANLGDLLDNGADPKEVTDFFWKGLLLKHKGNPLLHPYANSINSLLHPIAR